MQRVGILLSRHRSVLLYVAVNRQHLPHSPATEVRAAATVY
jgi:hypothetical protein